MLQTSIQIISDEGLHARPASEFSREAMSYASDVLVYKNDVEKAYNAKSILSIMSMGAAKGDILRIVVTGEDEELALLGLVNVLKSFGN